MLLLLLTLRTFPLGNFGPSFVSFSLLHAAVLSYHQLVRAKRCNRQMLLGLYVSLFRQFEKP